MTTNTENVNVDTANIETLLPIKSHREARWLFFKLISKDEKYVNLMPRNESRLIQHIHDNLRLRLENKSISEQKILDAREEFNQNTFSDKETEWINPNDKRQLTWLWFFLTKYAFEFPFFLKIDDKVKSELTLSFALKEATTPDHYYDLIIFALNELNVKRGIKIDLIQTLSSTWRDVVSMTPKLDWISKEKDAAAYCRSYITKLIRNKKTPEDWGVKRFHRFIHKPLLTNNEDITIATFFDAFATFCIMINENLKLQEPNIAEEQLTQGHQPDSALHSSSSTSPAFSGTYRKNQHHRKSGNQTQNIKADTQGDASKTDLVTNLSPLDRPGYIAKNMHKAFYEMLSRKAKKNESQDLSTVKLSKAAKLNLTMLSKILEEKPGKIIESALQLMLEQLKAQVNHK